MTTLRAVVIVTDPTFRGRDVRRTLDYCIERGYKIVGLAPTLNDANIKITAGEADIVVAPSRTTCGLERVEFVSGEIRPSQVNGRSVNGSSNGSHGNRPQRLK